MLRNIVQAEPVTKKSFVKALLVVSSLLLVLSGCVFFQFVFFKEQAIACFRLPVAAWRVLLFSAKLIEPGADDLQRSIAGRHLVKEMAILGYRERACSLALLLLRAEFSQTSRPINCDNVNELFCVYGIIDKDRKMPADSFREICAPAKDYASELAKDYRNSDQGSPLSKALGPNGLRLDRIYNLLGRFYARHGCMSESIDCILIAIESSKRDLGPDSTTYHNYLMQLASRYHEMGRDAEARKWALLSKVSLGNPARFEDDNMKAFSIRHLEYCSEFLSELSN